MAKKRETDPIADDELLLRRVWIDKFRTAKVPYISPSAFEPRITGKFPDTDGISLYRLDCLTQIEDALRTIQDEAKKRKTGLVGLELIEIKVLIEMKLTVRISPNEEILGHVVVPELNCTDYEKDRERFKKTLFALAVKASSPQRIFRDPNDETI